jgi:hypothetical protein
MTSLYFICLNYVANDNKFKLLYKKYLTNIENDRLEVNKNSKLMLKIIYKNLQNINYKYIPNKYTYNLNEIILSDLFCLMFIKPFTNINKNNNEINIKYLPHFRYNFPDSIYLTTNQYLFSYDSIFIKILLLNKFNLNVTKLPNGESIPMNYNIHKYNDKSIVTLYNIQEYNFLDFDEYYFLDFDEYYILELFNKK